MAGTGLWVIDGFAPRRIHRVNRVDLEANLERWIGNDISLLDGSLTVVGSQIRLQGGILDLLAIDQRGRWVVIELKRGRLARPVLTQALDYASSIAELSAQEMRDLIDRHISGSPHASELVERLLESEDEPREIAIVLVGTAVDPGLGRMIGFLADRFEVPVSIVTFDVYESDGFTVLAREIIEETEPRGSQRTTSIEHVLGRADASGFGTQMRRIVRAASANGFPVRPFTRGVMVTPPSHRGRFLVWAMPHTKGRMRLTFSPEGFEEFFPTVTANEVEHRLGQNAGPYVEGAGLENRIEAIEQLLHELGSGPDTEP